jgi:hypothetical protein
MGTAGGIYDLGLMLFDLGLAMGRTVNQKSEIKNQKHLAKSGWGRILV